MIHNRSFSIKKSVYMRVLFQPCLALLPSDYLLICKEFMGKNVGIISDAPLKRIE